MKQKAGVKWKAVCMMCFTRKAGVCTEMHYLPGVAELQWLTKPLYMAHERDFLAGNSSWVVWWLGLWRLPGYSHLCGQGDIEESRAVGLSPGPHGNVFSNLHCPFLCTTAWCCCRGTSRDIVIGTRWLLMWMVVAEGAWGPRAARVGLEGLKNVCISVELALHADNQICKLQISSPLVAAT